MAVYISESNSDCLKIKAKFKIKNCKIIPLYFSNLINVTEILRPNYNNAIKC